MYINTNVYMYISKFYTQFHHTLLISHIIPKKYILGHLHLPIQFVIKLDECHKFRESRSQSQWLEFQELGPGGAIKLWSGSRGWNIYWDGLDHIGKWIRNIAIIFPVPNKILKKKSKSKILKRYTIWKQN